jgi:hypothetical protein
VRRSSEPLVKRSGFQQRIATFLGSLVCADRLLRDQRFGVQCLMRFYPRRCGGLNPALALKSYLREKRHQELLRRYSAIATASEHMRHEYIKQGFEPRAVRMVSSPMVGDYGPMVGDSGEGSVTEASAIVFKSDNKFGEPSLRLLFLGRMVTLSKEVNYCSMLYRLPQPPCADPSR